MKCLLVMPRWSEQGVLLPASGRPCLDLTLECLGITSLSVMELDEDHPFDPADVPERYKVILVQDCGGGSRLRRSLLSTMGLSLGLGAEESDHLKVLGTRTLTDKHGKAIGFAVERRGRLVAYFRQSIWAGRTSLLKLLRGFVGGQPSGGRRPRETVCWMVECAGEPLKLGEYLVNETYSHCRIHHLSTGDAGVVIPALMGTEFKHRIHEQLGNRIYALAPTPLEEIVAEQLIESGLTVTTAESCTTGLIAARLSALPGASAYLMEGVVTYSNSSKQRLLQVEEELLKSRGAVSREVALAMAQGALAAGGTDLAVAVTGIAGPDGGSADKPVGTVHLAVCHRNGQTLEHRGFYRGSRERIRWQASQTALHLLRRMVGFQGEEQGR
ncbi:MAG: CinA family protein [Magnetococcales bacterium]|nr:CinA family protein [Magnetococcales bacterium]NGZ05666.1 CinA family protein [Magnetococcales bacterium]